MKKVLKLLTILSLVVLMTFSTVACSGVREALRQSKKEKEDPNKTTLYVHNYAGGFGTGWLEAAAKRFEEKFADEHFEEGKTGVVVKIKAQKKNILPSDNLGKMEQEIFFNEGTDYYSLVNNGMALDITDIISETLTEYGETQSILDKFYDEEKAYYSINGRYYGLPHYLMTMGIQYNDDVFNQGYYILNTNYDATVIEAEYESGKTTVAKNSIKFGVPNAESPEKSTNLSAGPDGEVGTFDDGLPATYAEFYLLCDAIADDSIYPLHWAGQSSKSYLNYLLFSLSAKNDGKEQMSLNYNYSSDTLATTVIDHFDANGTPVLKDAYKIDSSNGYELKKQAGKYYAIDFLNTIFNNTKFYDQTGGRLWSKSHAHTTASREFVKAGIGDSPKQIAMLIDGSWWEGESNDVFEKMEREYGSAYSKKNRHFKYLPLPFAKASMIGNKETLHPFCLSLGFIKSSIAPSKVKAAKEFLKFCYTDESLCEYTEISNSTRPLKYEVPDESLAKMTDFGRTYQMAKQSGDVCMPISGDTYFLSNRSKFGFDNFFTGKITGGATIQSSTYAYPGTYHKGKDYITYMFDYSKANWN